MLPVTPISGPLMYWIPVYQASEIVDYSTELLRTHIIPPKEMLPATTVIPPEVYPPGGIAV